MQTKLPSPDGRISVTISHSDGPPALAVDRDGRAVLIASPLAIDLHPGGLLGQELHATAERRREIDETYSIIAGKASSARCRCNELVVSMEEPWPPGRRVDVVVRAFDDAVAFRIQIPAQPGLDNVTVIAERSEFRFDAPHTCYPTTYPHFRSSFEEEYPKKKLTDIKPGQLVGLPLTILVEDGPAVAVLEADLTDYPGMYLEGLWAGQPWLVSRLAPLPEGQYGCAKGKLPIQTPWRVIQIADSPVKLIESDVLYHLNPPCVIADPAWIKPGKVTWDWWSGQAAPGKPFEGTHSTELMKHYVDFAADLRLEYMLVDGGWYPHMNSPQADATQPVSDLDMPGLVGYANAKGVDIMVWMHWADLREDHDRIFGVYRGWGVKGIKVDFFDRDDQWVVNHIQRLVAKAAEYRLVVDLHGVYKPTGIERTYPNLLSHEGVLGAEYNKWSHRITPAHNVTLPFTRMLAGPMDYTPGGFQNATKPGFVPQNRYPMVLGTRCHNMAMYVVYQSGLQMVSDHPDAIRGQPGSEFLREVPAAWDQTIGLAGEVGQYVVVARRKGHRWFIGAMADEAPRTLEIRLSMLGDGGWTLTAFADADPIGADPKAVAITTTQVTAGQTLQISLAPAGGWAGLVEPA